jgi:methyltransferase (TIGR00027 family)
LLIRYTILGGFKVEENQISHTALSAAYIRAYHARYDNPRIFDDRLACHLLTDETWAVIEQQFTKPLKHINPERAALCPDDAATLAWSMRTMAVPSIALARARYTEDKLEETVGQGVQQYVILGAGMDTFAFRHPEMLDKLQVFEVDHPATQSHKLHRLTELGWELPEQLHFVPIDFMQESLAEACTRSSYNPRAQSFFNWLGVTMFLTRDAVLATLRDIAEIAPPGSSIIFDYMDTDSFIPGRAPKRVQMMLEGVRRLGEPMLCGFDPFSLDEELVRLGLFLQENLSPSDIQERYFQNRKDGYYATEHAYIACVVVK